MSSIALTYPDALVASAKDGDAQRDYIDLGRLGVKSGRDFYDESA
jgi:hypothetical protein